MESDHSGKVCLLIVGWNLPQLICFLGESHPRVRPTKHTVWLAAFDLPRTMAPNDLTGLTAQEDPFRRMVCCPIDDKDQTVGVHRVGAGIQTVVPTPLVDMAQGGHIEAILLLKPKYGRCLNCPSHTLIRFFIVFIFCYCRI